MTPSPPRSADFTDPPHQNLQPSLVPLDSGRLVAVMRNHGQGWLWVMASDDAGRSWTPPRDNGFSNPGSAAALFKLADSRLLLVFNDSETVRHPLSVTLSADATRRLNLTGQE